MELRPVPVGASVFAHRGPTNLVRLLPGSKLLSTVPDFQFTPDPSDAATRTILHHIVEGVYARLLAPDATVAATNVEFGPRLTEASLPSDFPDSQCSLNGYVRRVDKEATRPGRAPLVVRGASFE